MQTLRLAFALAAAAAALLVVSGAAGAGPIVVSDCAAVCPQPANLYGTGAATITVLAGGNVTDVDVKLNGLSTPRPENLDVLLVGPGGQSVVLMSDAGGQTGVPGLNVRLDDEALDSLPDDSGTPFAAQSYQPTNHSIRNCQFPEGDDTGDGFPAPAPQTSHASALSAFDGTMAAGMWRLYVTDDCDDDQGGSMNWCVVVETDLIPATEHGCAGGVPTSTTLRSFTAVRAKTGTKLSWRTASESQALGFHVYRTAAGKTLKLTRTLVAARRSGAGATYALVDRTVPVSGAVYRLQLVRLDGTRAWLASAR